MEDCRIMDIPATVLLVLFMLPLTWTCQIVRNEAIEEAPGVTSTTKDQCVPVVRY